MTFCNRSYLRSIVRSTNDMCKRILHLQIPNDIHHPQTFSQPLSQNAKTPAPSKHQIKKREKKRIQRIEITTESQQQHSSPHWYTPNATNSPPYLPPLPRVPGWNYRVPSSRHFWFPCRRWGHVATFLVLFIPSLALLPRFQSKKNRGWKM